jgi:hypothetical protein
MFLLLLFFTWHLFSSLSPSFPLILFIAAIFFLNGFLFGGICQIFRILLLLPLGKIRFTEPLVQATQLLVWSPSFGAWFRQVQFNWRKHRLHRNVAIMRIVKSSQATVNFKSFWFPSHLFRWYFDAVSLGRTLWKNLYLVGTRQHWIMNLQLPFIQM